MGKVSGVYAITHPTSGRAYVGSSKDILARFGEHQRSLRRGAHHSSYLQKAWDKYGNESFHFGVLEYCSEAECIDREQYWIDQIQSSNKQFGFNLSPMARSGFPSPLCKEKMISANKMRAGSTWKASDPESWKAKISASRTGKKYGPRNPEVGRKIAESLRGTPHSEERKKNISNSIMALSPEARSARAFKAWETKRAKKEVL